MSVTTSEQLLDLADRVEARDASSADNLATVVIAALNSVAAGRILTVFDDALGLMGKGWAWRRLTGDSVSVYRTDPHVKAARRFDGYHSQPAAALVAAILKAKADSLAIAEKTSARGVL